MQRAANNGAAVVILAGGESRRFPGKLETEIGGVPMLLRVYRNVREAGPVYISANGLFNDTIARELDCPVVPDDEPGHGPLGALISTFKQVGCARAFVVAGDAPLIDCAVLDALAAVWSDEIEAAIAERGGRLEPLCGLYDCEAFLREAAREYAQGSGAVKRVVQRLRHRRVRLENQDVLASVNTVADRDALIGTAFS